MPARIPDDQIVCHFWSKVNKNGPVPPHRPELGPCWIWQEGTNGRGYGVFSVRRKKVYAHRFVCELTYGPLGEKEQARHKCDNGRGGCVRPDHIEPGTALDNSRDAKERGLLSRAVCRNGHNYAEVGVYVDGPDSKTPGKRQCKACARAQRPSQRCAGVVLRQVLRQGEQCARKIPVGQEFCHAHRP